MITVINLLKRNPSFDVIDLKYGKDLHGSH